MKYILLYRNNKSVHKPHCPGPVIEDVSRSSRYVGPGCDGRCGVRRFVRRTKTLAAYGEVVWSWRRDRGVKLRGKSHAVTVANNAAHRGEHV